MIQEKPPCNEEINKPADEEEILSVILTIVPQPFV